MPLLVNLLSLTAVRRPTGMSPLAASFSPVIFRLCASYPLATAPPHSRVFRHHGSVSPKTPGGPPPKRRAAGFCACRSGVVDGGGLADQVREVAVLDVDADLALAHLPRRGVADAVERGDDDAVLGAEQGGADAELLLRARARAVVDGEQHVVGALEPGVAELLVLVLEGRHLDDDPVELRRDLVQVNGDRLVVARALAGLVVPGVLDGVVTRLVMQRVHQLRREADAEDHWLLVLEEDCREVQVGADLAGELPEEAALATGRGVPGDADADGAADLGDVAVLHHRQTGRCELFVRQGRLGHVRHGQTAPRPARHSLMDLPLLLPPCPRLPAGMPLLPLSPLEPEPPEPPLPFWNSSVTLFPFLGFSGCFFPCCLGQSIQSNMFGASSSWRLESQ